jgi:hypothetical protein
MQISNKSKENKKKKKYFFKNRGKLLSLGPKREEKYSQ